MNQSTDELSECALLIKNEESGDDSAEKKRHDNDIQHICRGGKNGIQHIKHVESSFRVYD